MSAALTSAGHSLVAVQDNLIDVVWPDRPERPSTQLRTLGLEYTGQCLTVAYGYFLMVRDCFRGAEMYECQEIVYRSHNKIITIIFILVHL